MKHKKTNAKLEKAQRRIFWTLILGSIAALPVIYMGLKTNTGPLVTVYKSPTCGCCKKWVAHLESNGFNVKTIHTNNMSPVKVKHGVPGELSSCHTAIVEGYTIEGHVPAGDIQHLLQERPNVKGLAVPGMPIGSPGMEQGDRKDPYKVVTFTKQRKQGVYAYHE